MACALAGYASSTESRSSLWTYVDATGPQRLSRRFTVAGVGSGGLRPWRMKGRPHESPDEQEQT
jgi:hypothetical protein